MSDNLSTSERPKKKLKRRGWWWSKRPTKPTNQAHSTMAATIMMPKQLDASIREMCSDAMTKAVDILAEKYGFDAEEANRFLDVDALKLERKRGPAGSPKGDKPPTKKGSKQSKESKQNKPSN